METTIFAASDWPAVTDNILWLPVVGAVALMIWLAIALVLTVLFQPLRYEPGQERVPANEGTVDTLTLNGGASRLSTGTAAPLGSARMAVAVAAGSRSQNTAVDQLKNGSFTPTDIIALQALRARVATGEVADGPTSQERLAFARWLVGSGRLSG